MIKANVSQTIQHLRQEMDKEAHELLELKEKVRLAQEDVIKRNQEIPKLRQQLEDDRHQIYVDETDEEKYKRRIAEIQREKLHNQAELNELNNSQRSDAIQHSKLTR